MPPPSKKELILEEAKRMFARRGYAATIMDDLAKAAGVNKATIYYHFKDKATLYETLFLEGIRKIADQIVAQTDAIAQPERKLERYILIYARMLQECHYLTSILLRELAGGGDSMPASVLEQLLRTTRRLAQILEACGKQSGRVCHEPMLIQLIIVSTLSSFITTEPIRRRVKEELDPDAPTLPPLTPEDVARKLTYMIQATLTKGEDI